MRFRDLDPMGHAHHSLVLVYIEEARAAYWRDVVQRPDVGAIDYIMGDVSIRFHKRILFPGTLDIALRVTRLGGGSFDMEYEVRDASGELAASARTTQVMYDYAAARSMEIPGAVRARITEYEPGL